MITYIALLRGINVWGKNILNMEILKSFLKDVWYQDVSTYINSGNIIFRTEIKDKDVIRNTIEQTISKNLDLQVSVFLRTLDELKMLAANIPVDRIQNKEWKTDVIFLDTAIDSPEILGQFAINSDIEQLIYFPGVLVRHIAYSDYNHSKFPRIIGGNLYKQMTIRNINTVRKLAALTS